MAFNDGILLVLVSSILVFVYMDHVLLRYTAHNT